MYVIVRWSDNGSVWFLAGRTELGGPMWTSSFLDADLFRLDTACSVLDMLGISDCSVVFHHHISNGNIKL